MEGRNGQPLERNRVLAAELASGDAARNAQRPEFARFMATTVNHSAGAFSFPDDSSQPERGQICGFGTLWKEWEDLPESDR